MENRIIPPNIHYIRPREGVEGLTSGRLDVITELTPLEGNYVSVSSFGFGGANAHLLLKSNSKKKFNHGFPQDKLLRLVAVSARTEDGVKSILNDIESRLVDAEYIRLYHEIHSKNILHHPYRGYTIVGQTKKSESPIREIQYYESNKRPLWYVFSGIGSQWPGCGEELLKIPVFSKAIEKCNAVLKPLGVNIYDVLTNKDEKVFNNAINTTVAITAIQIGLIDLLNQVGIVPDNIIGHSMGEFACAYADSSLTAEQTILSSYSLGLVSTETTCIQGSMAAIGMSHRELKKLCSANIDIAYHNGPISSTVSGTSENVKALIIDLQAENIFAKEVPCSSRPFHSRYVTAAGPKLISYLRQIIPNAKPRSSMWLSTSVPKSAWSSSIANSASAEYFTNNLLSPVLFEEACAFIPENAIVIEISPHGWLQEILKRSLHSNVTNISLTRQEDENNVQTVLQGLGKLYNLGFQPQLARLYPNVQFPVSRGTPMISPLIKWEHSDDWFVCSNKPKATDISGERIVRISVNDADYDYLTGHVIDGRNLFPAAGYLILIWETISLMIGKLLHEVSVVFEDVAFLRATNVPKDGALELIINFQKGTGNFEIMESNTTIVTGKVRVTSNPANVKCNLEEQRVVPITKHGVSKNDIYKELRLHGYQYSGQFRGLESCNVEGTEYYIKWEDNWVTFIDNMLQMKILRKDTRRLFVPTRISSLVIDTSLHWDLIRSLKFAGILKKGLVGYVNENLDTLTASGVEIKGLKVSSIAKRKQVNEPVLETYEFIPDCDGKEYNLDTVVRLMTHVAIENQLRKKVKTVELITAEDDVKPEESISSIIVETLENLPSIQPEVIIIAKNIDNFTPLATSIIKNNNFDSVTDAVIGVGYKLLSGSKNEKLNCLLQILDEGGFLITRELQTNNVLEEAAKKYGLHVIMEKKVGKHIFVLLRKRNNDLGNNIIVKVENNNFDWLEEMKKMLKTEFTETSSRNGRVLFVAEGDNENGLLGLINCLRKELKGEFVRGFLLQDENAPKFSLKHPLYADRLRLDLVMNVLRSNDVWGSYRHLMLPPLLPKPVIHAWVHQEVAGDLSRLHWIEGPDPTDDSEVVRVMYAPLNFRDIMMATGKLAAEVIAKTRMDEECVLGCEYCGIDALGRRVMGLTRIRGLSNMFTPWTCMQWEIPETWSFEDAATIPIVYATCVYALYMGGQMKKDDKVLIHVGSGGAGQAAINLALFEGCEVFTTVGTEEKRQFIKKTFPQIQDDHIGNSRDCSFEQLVMNQTHGQGVDIVLNSLTGDKLQASVRCLAKNGRFLEIGKYDLVVNNTIGMDMFSKGATYLGVMLDNLLYAPQEKQEQVRDLVEKGLGTGAIKPLSRIVFPPNKLEEAFRLMAAGNHIGKVLIKVREENEPLNTPMPALPRYYCKEDRSYIILGGLGGFGLELADWLVLRGAKNLILTSRQGLRTGYQKMRVNLWKSYGLNIKLVVGKDASKEQDCRDILESAMNLAPVDGIFNLAVVLRDATWENQTIENFETTFQAKARATKQLDTLTRLMCPNLRHFVVFSSVSCGRGNAGQTNYGMANSVMERICENRVKEGFPSLAIQWGAIGDVGLVAEMQGDKEISISGALPQKISSCLQKLDDFLNQKCPVVSSMVIAEKHTGGVVATNIVDAVLNIIGLSEAKIFSQHTSLAEMGLDSMFAIEVKQTLERDFEVFLTAQEIRDLTPAKLRELGEKPKETKNEKPVKKLGYSYQKMKILLPFIDLDKFNFDVCVPLESKQEANDSLVFMFAGIEGSISVFRNLAKKIKFPVICLQARLKNLERPTISDMVDNLLPVVLQKMEKYQYFVIVGYSYGTFMALELSRQLEKKGLSGRVVIIDSSPGALIAIKKEAFSSNTEVGIQNEFTLEFLKFIDPEINQNKVLNDYEKCASWNEKLDTCISYILKKNKTSNANELKEFLDSVYKRFASIDSYDPKSAIPLKSPMYLIKAAAGSLNSPSDDYGMKKMTSGKFEAHSVDADHISILNNPKVAAAINYEL